MQFFLSFFWSARMSFDISFPRSLGLLDSESELEELELLPPGGGPSGGTTLLGGLLCNGRQGMGMESRELMMGGDGDLGAGAGVDGAAMRWRGRVL
jgi:hypothetical protein